MKCVTLIFWAFILSTTLLVQAKDTQQSGPNQKDTILLLFSRHPSADHGARIHPSPWKPAPFFYKNQTSNMNLNRRVRDTGVLTISPPTNTELTTSTPEVLNTDTSGFKDSGSSDDPANKTDSTVAAKPETITEITPETTKDSAVEEPVPSTTTTSRTDVHRDDKLFYSNKAVRRKSARSQPSTLTRSTEDCSDTDCFQVDPPWIPDPDPWIPCPDPMMPDPNPAGPCNSPPRNGVKGVQGSHVMPTPVPKLVEKGVQGSHVMPTPVPKLVEKGVQGSHVMPTPIPKPGFQWMVPTPIPKPGFQWMVPTPIPWNFKPSNVFPFFETKGVELSESKSMGLKVVGGHETTIEKHPYQVSLHFKSSPPFCGGSIISKDTILTAAHCFDQIDEEKHNKIVIKAGATDHTMARPYRVSKVIINKDYESMVNENDMAIIKLAKDLTFTKRLQPIKLQPPGTRIPSGTQAVVSGWGTLVADKRVQPRSLHEAALFVISNKQCQRMYDPTGDTIYSTMLCTLAPGRDSCQGDSGGPLVADGKLIGVVSWGEGCADAKFPGVYANVSAMHKFVSKYM